MKKVRPYSQAWVKRHSQEREAKESAQAVAAYLTTRLPKGSRILDIGCASGHLVDALCKKGFAGYGIDTSPNAIAYCQRHCQGSYIRGEVKAFRKAYSHSFDGVVISHLLEHFEKPDGLLEEVEEVIKRHGLLYVAVPNMSGYHPENPLLDNPYSLFDREHKRYFTAEALDKALSDCSFIQIESWGYTTERKMLGNLIRAMSRRQRTRPLSFVLKVIAFTARRMFSDKPIKAPISVGQELVMVAVAGRWC